MNFQTAPYYFYGYPTTMTSGKTFTQQTREAGVRRPGAPGLSKLRVGLLREVVAHGWAPEPVTGSLGTGRTHSHIHRD